MMNRKRAEGSLPINSLMMRSVTMSATQRGRAVRDLTRREADLALRVVRPTSGDLVMTRLTTARWVLVAAPKLASRLGTLRDFGAAPWVSWGERLAQLGAARWLAKHAKGVEPVVRSDSLTVQLAAVRSGAGVALVPEPTASHYGLVPVKLAVPGTVHKVELDTNHFKGNYPDRCSLEGVSLKEPLLDFANAQLPWKEILPQTKLGPDACHVFEKEIANAGPFTHVRLNIFPDGGVSRLRLFGVVE